MAMGYEMSRETLRAAQLSDDLRESEERMTLAGTAAGFGVWMWNIPRNQVWASERWRNIFGFAPEAAVTFEGIIERIHPEDRELVESGVQRAVKDRQDYAAEYRILLPNGTQRWVLARGKVYADSKGKPMRMLGATMEITQRKEAESALKETSQKFRLVVEASPSGILLADEKGRMTLVNEQLTKLFGYAREELVGQSVDLLVPERFQTEHAAQRNRFHQAPSARMMGQGRELFGRRKDGTEFPLEIGLSHIPGPKGILVLASVVDVTTRKRSDLQIAQQRDQLAHLSRVNMLGELAGSLAHELNQPLTAILSNAQAAQRFLTHEPVDLSEVRDILADIVGEDKRAGEVIRRLRLLLKHGEVQHQPLNVNEAVQEVLRLVRSDLVNHSCTAQTELAPHLPVLHGDRVQIQQVLLNLVMNACDAMADTERDTRQLTIRTSRAKDGCVHIEVADGGTGIAQERLEEVFTPFYTTKPQGLGLGLAVCRTIITAHGGRLWATNNPGRGATFHFTLPGPKQRQSSGFSVQAEPNEHHADTQPGSTRHPDPMLRNSDL